MAARTTPDDDVLEWVKKDNHRFLHADIRVGDLNSTIKYVISGHNCVCIHIFKAFSLYSNYLNISSIDRFYTESLGMKLLSQKDFPEQKYSKAIVGFGPQDTHFVLELTYSMTTSNCPVDSLILFCFITS